MAGEAVEQGVGLGFAGVEDHGQALGLRIGGFAFVEIALKLRRSGGKVGEGRARIREAMGRADCVIGAGWETRLSHQLPEERA